MEVFASTKIGGKCKKSVFAKFPMNYFQSHVNRAVMDNGVPLDSNLGNLSNRMSK